MNTTTRLRTTAAVVCSAAALTVVSGCTTVPAADVGTDSAAARVPFDRATRILMNDHDPRGRHGVPTGGFELLPPRPIADADPRGLHGAPGGGSVRSIEDLQRGEDGPMVRPTPTPTPDQSDVPGVDDLRRLSDDDPRGRHGVPRIHR
ncbi:hypothetical protein [Agromyces protaetiae]|uniref:hypothetical protein n=1 Tax=Agromyces protaetiae TaxID=2509455 RepID=UPI0013EAB158|nr:hypothetical protein [Agromyces protaetiae]